MKHFVLSLLLFGLLVTLVAFNAHLVGEKTAHLASLVSLLAESPDVEGAERISEYWKENENFFSLSLNTSELERVEEYISELCASAVKNDAFAYSVAAEKLKNAVGGLDDGEKFDFYGIF